jgi:hypothetical protein
VIDLEWKKTSIVGDGGSHIFGSLYLVDGRLACYQSRLALAASEPCPVLIIVQALVHLDARFVPNFFDEDCAGGEGARIALAMRAIGIDWKISLSIGVHESEKLAAVRDTV